MTAQMLLPMPTGTLWIEVRDGDPRALALFKRHYSYRPYADGRRDDPTYANRWLTVGPGEKTVLLHLADNGDADALFTWRRYYSKWAQATIVENAAFRNESPLLASDMIRAALQLAWARWPDETALYTSVNPRKIRSSNPGYCFKLAGFRKCGLTKSGLIMFQALADVPSAIPLARIVADGKDMKH